MFSLPVAAHMTTPAAAAAEIAGSMTEKSHPEGPIPSPGAYCLKLMLITAAPLATAQLIPAATSASVQFWKAPGRLRPLPAAPATPSPWWNDAAATPAHDVP